VKSSSITVATVALGATVALLIGVPSLALMLASTREPAHDLGPVTRYPTGEFRQVTFDDRTAFVRRNDRLSFTILSGRDANLGCPVLPIGPFESAARRSFGGVTLMPVQPSSFGSTCREQYDTEGNPLADRGTRALDRYAFSIRNGRLVLGAPFHVSHVDGTGAAARRSTISRPSRCRGRTPTRPRRRRRSSSRPASRRRP
jgi:hypothetical protein